MPCACLARGCPLLVSLEVFGAVATPPRLSRVRVRVRVRVGVGVRVRVRVRVGVRVRVSGRAAVAALHAPEELQCAW